MAGTAEPDSRTAGIPGQRRPVPTAEERHVGPALLEQAKGVLIFHFGVDEATAFAIITAWSSTTGADIMTVALALVHDISQGGEHVDPALVGWLEAQLHGDRPEVAKVLEERTGPVVVRLDHSYTSLDLVVAAAREAARAGVPLEIALDAAAPHDTAHARAQLMQKVDLAIELARAVEPGLVVRLPRDNPFEAESTPVRPK